MADEVVNPLGVSDEDFQNMAPPTQGEPSVVEESAVVVEEPAVVEEPVIEQEQTTEEESEKVEEPKVEEDPAPGSGEAEVSAEEKAKAEEKPADAVVEPVKIEPVKTDEPAYVPPSDEVAQQVYKQIMSPIKANGKTIELKSPEEAVTLMQLGANYTKKMQALQPHRKALLMLQNAELLDEGKLDYLIALDKKDPEAIKKLIKDSGIDPMDIDTSVEPAYLEGSHRITDTEVNFRNTLDDLLVTESGKATVTHIYNDWDQTSRDAVAVNPDMMRVIHQQRETGVYDLISSEIDRRRVLGQIAPSTPFLEAYTVVGKEMADAALKETGTEQPVQVKQPEVVATRTVAPKSNVENSDKAAAAAPTRTASKKAQTVVNPLALSDDEFMKLDQFKNRL